MRSGVGCLTDGARRGPEDNTALSCVSVTSFEIGKCCVPLCPASPILICSPGSFVGADGCYGFFFPIYRICHHDFDRNDIESEGGFRNCGHFHKMRLPPHEPRMASQSLVWLSAQVLCSFGSVSLLIENGEGSHILHFLPECSLSGHSKATLFLG